MESSRKYRWLYSFYERLQRRFTDGPGWTKAGFRYTSISSVCTWIYTRMGLVQRHGEIENRRERERERESEWVCSGRRDYRRLKREKTQFQGAVLRSNLAIGQSKMKTCRTRFHASSTARKDAELLPNRTLISQMVRKPGIRVQATVREERELEEIKVRV